MIRGLTRKARSALEYNHEKIQHVLHLYETRQLKNTWTLENAVVGLSYPSLFGKKKAEELYLKATGEYLKQKTFKA